jgi:hypothetical protein
LARVPDRRGEIPVTEPISTNLYGWFSGDSGLLNSINPDVEAVSVNSGIRRWVNRVSGGVNADQITAAAQPVLILPQRNSVTYRGIRFNSGDVLLLENSTALNSSLSIYVALSAFPTGTLAGESFIFNGSRSVIPTQPRNALYVNTSGKLTLRKSTAVASTIDSSSPDNIFFGVIDSGGTGTIGKRNQGQTTRENLTGLGTGQGSLVTSFIGAGNTTGAIVSNIDMLELLVYTTVHTTEEQNQIIDYLRNKYPFIA